MPVFDAAAMLHHMFSN